MAAKKPVTQIASKLHPEYDQDLIKEIEKIPLRDRSRAYREGMRFFFKYRDIISKILEKQRLDE